MKKLYEGKYYALQRWESGYILKIKDEVGIHFTSLEDTECVEGEKEFVLSQNGEPMCYLTKAKLSAKLRNKLDKI